MSLSMMPPVVQEVKYEGNAPGKPGRGISRAEIVDGDLVLYFTDDTSQNVGRVLGEKGESIKGDSIKGDSIQGDTGRGIQSAAITDAGDLELTFDDGVVNVGRVRGKDAATAKDGRSIIRAEQQDGDLLLFYSDGTYDNVGSVRGKPGNTPRSVESADLRDGRLVLVWSDRAETDLGKIVPDVPIVRDGVDGRSVTSARMDDDGNLWLWFSNGAEQNIGRVRGFDGRNPDPHPAPKNATEIVTASVIEGNLVLLMSDGREIKAGRVKGDPGDVTTIQAASPRGRVLFGKIGRLTADRKSPGAANTLNIPDNFGRAVMLLITDGVASGCVISGFLSRGEGPETTTWQEWDRRGNAPIVTTADTVNGGLAVDAVTAGNWTCRMVGSPE